MTKPYAIFEEVDPTRRPTRTTATTG